MNLEVLRFPNREAFRAWLTQNHQSRESVWLEFRKGQGAAFTHLQALEEGLCFGWIDSLIKRVDSEWYRVKFTQRRAGSHWSQRNKKLAEELIAVGRMAAPGMEKIRAARQSGEWDRTPESLPVEAVGELEARLADHAGAADLFRAATPAQRTLLTRYYISAKKEDTRARRLARIADSLKTGKAIM